MLRELGYFARMAAGYLDFARTPPAPDPRGLVLRQLENRDASFLGLMRQVVFANASNPYHSLFRWADCTYGDLEHAVRCDGLEATLRALHAAGVHLSHDEFKGKKPIERGGRRIVARPRDFANPLVRGALETTSSGSRSQGTITRPSLEFQIYREAQESLFLRQFLSTPRVIGALFPILPSTVGLRRLLSCLRLGLPVEQWYTLGGSLRDSAHYRLMTRLLVYEAGLLGHKLRFPTYLPQNDFSPATRWIARRRSDGADVLFMAPVSFSVRVAAAAMDLGLDIRGTIFLSGAEPLTEAKRAVIESAGAEIFPRYGISELGWVGHSCRQMNKSNCVHLMRDSVAVVGHRWRPPLSDMELDSLLISTLLPCTAHVLVNVEMEDSGTLGPACCDCELKAMGFTDEIRDVYSYGKLTGQGVTLLGTDMLDVLEKNLPARFGGAPTDYQLVEREGASQTETELRVSPRVGAVSQVEVRDFFMSEVRRLWGGSLASRQWSQTGGVRVVFEEPLISGERKINSLHLLSSAEKGDH